MDKVWRHLFRTWSIQWSWGYVLFCMELPSCLMGFSFNPPTWVIHFPFFKIIVCIPYRSFHYTEGFHRINK